MHIIAPDNLIIDRLRYFVASMADIDKNRSAAGIEVLSAVGIFNPNPFSLLCHGKRTVQLTVKNMTRFFR